MNEKKKSIIVLSVFSALLVLVLILVLVTVAESNKKIKDFEAVINESDTNIVYFMKPSCYYCNLIEPITTKLKEKYDLDYYQIDTSKLSNSELTKMLKILNVDVSTFGTPYIAVVKDGNVLGEQSGYTDEDVLFELFKKHKLIDENENLQLNYIDKETLESLWNKDEESIVLIGETGSTSSIAARMELMSVLDEYNVSINYFDTSKFSSTEEYNEWLTRIDEDALPNLVIMKNGNVIAKTTDTSKEKYIDFLKQNGYID